MENFEKYPFSENHWESHERRQVERRVSQRRKNHGTSHFSRYLNNGALMFITVLLFGVFGFYLASGLNFDSKRLMNTTATKIGAMEGGERDFETVTVEKGDTLSSIAQRAYGRSNRVGILYQANRDILKSPNDLKLGQKIRIP